jgi:hypothetical protein
LTGGSSAEVPGTGVGRGTAQKTESQILRRRALPS